MASLWSRLVHIAVLPGDEEDLQIRKRLQVTMALWSLPAVFGWGACFVAIGRLDGALLAWAYCVATIAMLALLARTGRWSLFRSPHTGLVLLGPAFLHWYLGGFAASGGALMWSFIAPVAATLFGSRSARAWFVSFIVLAALGFVREVFFPLWAHPLAPAQASFFFAFNATAMALFLYLSTRDFLVRLAAERARSEELLLNVLPRSIAQRLKRRPGVIAERFTSVTVMFSDIVGFTTMSQRLDAVAVVALLNELFTAFDQLAQEHGLEKIKTIGDAYMIVGGLPEACDDHAQRVARMGLAMRDFIGAFARERGLSLAMRIGMHSGEVVAGVIGKRKFSYDLWGDTVNTASRMESHGAAGRVQVSDATRSLLGAGFEVEERGTIDVKGKGAMVTYWLNAERP